MENRTPEPPLPDACRTGHMFISPCCTARVREFLAGSTLSLASHVTEHGWSPAWPGRIEDTNNDGTIVEADGSERRICWHADREGP